MRSQENQTLEPQPSSADGGELSHEDSYNFFRNLLQAMRIKDSLLKRIKILPEKPLKVLVFCKLLKELIDAGYDCIVIDSVSEVFANNPSLDVLNAVFQIPLQAGTTILALNHLNKKCEIEGAEKIQSQFYSVYKMEAFGAKNASDETMLKITVEKSLHPEPEQDFILKRYKVSTYESAYEVIADDDSISVVLSSKESSVSDGIKEYIKSVKKSEISRDELFSYLKDKRKTISPDTVTNALGKLQREGLIHKIDRTWKRIGIIR
ncbi:hypothetical protein FACS1894172_03290 [Spirochaetia bacterium]|nr:hypothetical protein FACS1894172_03290 [Spirochaetia bacterium]